MIMIVAYAGGHHFFVYPKGGHHFLDLTKGGHVFLWGVLLVATALPPPVEIMNGPLFFFFCFFFLEVFIFFLFSFLNSSYSFCFLE